MPRAKPLPPDPDNVEGRLLAAMDQLSAVLNEIDDKAKGLQPGDYKQDGAILKIDLAEHIFLCVRDHIQSHCQENEGYTTSADIGWFELYFRVTKGRTDAVQIRFMADQDIVVGTNLDDLVEYEGYRVLGRVRSPFRSGWFLTLESHQARNNRELAPSVRSAPNSFTQASAGIEPTRDPYIWQPDPTNRSIEYRIDGNGQRVSRLVRQQFGVYDYAAQVERASRIPPPPMPFPANPNPVWSSVDEATIRRQREITEQCRRVADRVMRQVLPVIPNANDPDQAPDDDAL